MMTIKWIVITHTPDETKQWIWKVESRSSAKGWMTCSRRRCSKEEERNDLMRRDRRFQLGSEVMTGKHQQETISISEFLRQEMIDLEEDLKMEDLMIGPMIYQCIMELAIMRDTFRDQITYICQETSQVGYSRWWRFSQDSRNVILIRFSRYRTILGYTERSRRSQNAVRRPIWPYSWYR